jgi:hypothetical protein
MKSNNSTQTTHLFVNQTRAKQQVIVVDDMQM